MVTARPSPALRPLVERYVGYRQDGITLGVHRGLPSRSITLVISLAGPVRLVGGPGAGHGPRALQGSVGGLRLEPALLEQDTFQEGIHACLSPFGAQRLLGVSAGELSGAVCDLAELPVRWGRDLVDRLLDAPGWPARFAILDRALAIGVERAPVTLVGEVQWAWRQLVRHGGTPRVAQLAEQVGWSRRHFSQRFADTVGISPKQAARLVRFERSTARLRSGAVTSLAGLAADCGYYDQAHLANEWNQLAGCSPSAWIAEELPFLQDTNTGPGAGSRP